MANQQTPKGSQDTNAQHSAGKTGATGQRDQRNEKQQFGSQAGSTQRPMGSQSKTESNEDEESLEPVEHYSKGEDETDADIERPSDSSTSSTRKINR
jgi:hypothetical protein